MRSAMSRSCALTVALTVTRGLVGGWLLLLALACCTSRAVLQSGVVPLSEPAPPPTSHGGGDLYAAASGLTFMEPTEELNAGHYVPAAQLNLAGTFRPHRGITLRPMAVMALPTNATPLDPNGIENPNRLSVSGGLDFGYVFGSERTAYMVRPHVGVALLGVAMLIQDPAGTFSYPDIGWMAIVEGGLDGGYWVTPWLLIQGGVDVRNAPRVPAVVAACYGDDPPFVDWGAFALNVRVAAEVEIDHTASIVAAVSVPAVGNPYEPYPILTLGVRGILGEAPQRQHFERNLREPR